MSLKPYQQIPILDCQEPLVPIPPEIFAFKLPHPYQQLGAPYRHHSPFYVRLGVLQSLILAQNSLKQQYPTWKLQIFDAYRPIAVQQFMVDYTFQQLVEQQGLITSELTPNQRQEILEQVYQFWALPSANPATPPPHSTGAAVDVTLLDENHQPLNMGSPIDEVSSRSYPDYFANSADSTEQQYHHHRQVLAESLIAAGFTRHPNEWWHFSLGDQMWAWLTNLKNPDPTVFARYGGV